MHSPLKKSTSEAMSATVSSQEPEAGTSSCEMQALSSPPLEEEEEDTGQIKDPKTMEFQELFYNRATQHTAWTMFLGEKEKVVKNLMSADREGMTLRSVDQPTSPKSPSKTEKKGSDSGLFQRDVQGEAMVQELIDRYESNKMRDLFGDVKPKPKKTIKKRGRKKRKTPKSEDTLLLEDDLEQEELDFKLLDDLDANGESDFMKYTVPQYELKRRLYAMHAEKIEKMASSEVDNFCKEVIPDLKGIMQENIPSARHDTFKKCGINLQQLRDMTVFKPFTQAHNNKVMKRIEDMIGAEFGNEWNGNLLHYVCNVLIPEALIRIFALANQIPVDLAEKELRFNASYDGNLSEEIIRTIPPEVEQVNNENLPSLAPRCLRKH